MFMFNISVVFHDPQSESI